MQATIFRTKADGNGESLQRIDFNDLILSIKDGRYAEVVNKYRNSYLYLSSPRKWVADNKMPRVCTACEYYRNKQGQHLFRAYNGVSVVKITGLNGSLELEKAKSEAKLMPQTYFAAIGADGHSVIVLTLSTMPDGTLPRNEEDAEKYCLQAYMTSVQCLQPLLSFNIDVTPPSLDGGFLMTVDESPYVNAHPVSFIIEQPTDVSLRLKQKEMSEADIVRKMRPGLDTYLTFAKLFELAYKRALSNLVWNAGDKDDRLILLVAEYCYKCGLPAEETAFRLSTHFHEHDLDELRLTVNNVYTQNEGVDRDSLYVSKHQYVAIRLKEFLERRYEIRFNEILQMTEFRERQSMRFFFRELDRSELNRIHFEALIEGIEPTFGEVDELVHSSYIKRYNPIEDYLAHLPQWDGKDYIDEFASRVTTDNPYWHRLFRQWFLSMVAHWMNGDEQHANSTAPILIGAQGYRKSTFCRQILPPELQLFYTDSIDFRTNIEAERCLSRFLLVNIDEFDQLSEKQFAFVKHLFQKPATNIRRMYSEAIGRQRRYASFVGTTNSDEVLRDPTGNRRYLCVYVTAPIATDRSVNYAQLYAQAVHLINNKERYWLNDDDEALIRDTNRRFEVVQPLEALLLTAFDIPSAPTDGDDADGEWLRSTEILAKLQQLPAFNKQRDNNLTLLGRILTKLGVPKHRYNNGTAYLLKPKG